MVKIAINGFGRIGRAVLRAIYEQELSGVRVAGCAFETGNLKLETRGHGGPEQYAGCWGFNLFLCDVAALREA